MASHAVRAFEAGRWTAKSDRNGGMSNGNVLRCYGIIRARRQEDGTVIVYTGNGFSAAQRRMVADLLTVFPNATLTPYVR